MINYYLALRDNHALCNQQLSDLEEIMADSIAKNMAGAHFINVYGKTEIDVTDENGKKTKFNIDECTFEIPTYQRGFRWRKKQMEQLCDDLIEFEEDNNWSTYLMQPITVRYLAENKYEVADGQQRLTAIWIIRQLKGLVTGDDRPVYSLKYVEKGGFEDKIKELKDKINEIKTTYPAPVDLDSPDPNRTVRIEKFTDFIKKINSGKPNKKDIDAWHFIEAIKYIWGDYKVKIGGVEKGFKEIVDDHLFIDGKQYQFIWYDMHSDDIDSEAERLAIIKKFSKLNSGKIPLTNAEIIKAHFYRYLPNSEQDLFSFQWEEIENQLSEDSFWGFLLPSKVFNSYETRIDYLFEVYLKKDKHRSDDYTVSEEMKDSMKNSAKEAWKEILSIYNTFKMWYSDYNFYHLIGLFTELNSGGKSTPKKMHELYEKFGETGKKEFSNHLRDTIRNILFSENDSDSRPYWIPGDGYEKINIDDARYMDIDGDTSGKQYIEPLLLSFNVALLLNAYSINPENGAEKFPFEYYKTHTIEIEHINAKHLEGSEIDGEGIQREAKIQWAKGVISLVTDKDKKKTFEPRVKQFESSSDDLDDKNNDWVKFVNAIETAADLHSISNLTLLDRDVNNKYRDSQYYRKAPHIAAARFGFPIPITPAGDYQETDFQGNETVEVKVHDMSEKFSQGSGVEIGLNKAQIDAAEKIELVFTDPAAAPGQKYSYSFGIVTYNGKMYPWVKPEDGQLTEDLANNCFTATIPFQEEKGKTKGTNRSYFLTISNDVDPQKPLFSRIVISGYSNSVIFPGTMWVFMRQYIERADKIEQAASEFWTRADREHYEDYIKKALYLMLKKR